MYIVDVTGSFSIHSTGYSALYQLMLNEVDSVHTVEMEHYDCVLLQQLEAEKQWASKTEKVMRENVELRSQIKQTIEAKEMARSQVQYPTFIICVYTMSCMFLHLLCIM